MGKMGRFSEAMQKVVFLFLACLNLLLGEPTDHGVIILGGEGPDGPLDSIAVLTETGWCPPDAVIIPPLPKPQTGLTGHHGRIVGSTVDREYLMVCGFTGLESACFQISPLNGHFTWTPVGVEDESIDMSTLEYVHSYTNMIKDGVTSMWLDKDSGEYEFLWSPMIRSDADASFEQMAGWYRDSVPNLVMESPSLGEYAYLSCLAGHTLSDGYPSMVTLSGGYNGSESLNELLIMGNLGDGDWEWHRNSILLGETRSDHACLSLDYLGESGLLVGGGYSIPTGGIVPSSLNSLQFLFSEYGNHDDLSNYFNGLTDMVEGRSGFGLANWSEEGLVAIGGRKYGIFPGQSGSYLLRDSVEVWDKNENSWSVRDEWKMDIARAGFAIVSKGSYSEVHGSEYCNL